MTTIPEMIFFHVGWMEYYRGANDGDPTIGPHGHLKENKFGHECFNFFPRDRKCYGYVPTRNKIDISKLNASRNSNFVDDVVCVWIAKHPERNVRVIVGWYREAQVFRSSPHESDPSGNWLDHEDIEYRAVAVERNCSLIPTSRRTFEIPTRFKMDGGLGRSPVWYGGNAKFRGQVWNYIQNWEKRKGNKRRKVRSVGGRNTDPEQRRRVEEIAVNVAIDFFSSEEGGVYKVISKEKYNLGWDLEARRSNKPTLLIEVKGLSGDRVSIELTPNEYEKMISTEHRDSYVLFVVTNCLTDHPEAYDYRFDNGRWKETDGTLLEIEKRIGAVCRAALPLS